MFFIITKAHASEFSFPILAQSMMHSLWLDMSMAGYFTLFYCLMFLGGLASPVVFRKIFTVFHWLVLTICTLAIISNAVLYSFWSGPLDYSAIKFLKTPKEALASVNWLLMIIPIMMGIGLFLLFRFVFIKWNFIRFDKAEHNIKTYMIQIPALLLMAGICIIPIRGGFGIVPVNLSFVYFHKEAYPNHAAYNPVWNVLYSWANSGDENNYAFMDDSNAVKIFEGLHKLNKTGLEGEMWIPGTHHNIVVIVMESFLYKLVDLEYNGEEVTPNFNKLTKSGIYFNNLYATGDRSDKGLLAVFSGYPAMPKSSMAQFPEKFQKLPSIFKAMNNAGYGTAFYYGGNLDFANLRSYFLSAGAGKIVSGDDLPKSYKSGKWGVHDEYMFDEFIKGISYMKQPFFTGLFTLSNHEPFDIPNQYHFGKSNGDEEYMSAAYYSDQCIGKFVEKLKSSRIWENTLVVFVSDHGVARLGINEIYNPEKFHIPMVWTGGVIKTPKTITKVCSQTDIPLLMLNQCCIKPDTAYRYSKEVDQHGSREFAPYFYNDGVGFVTPGCISIYDNISGKFESKFCQNDTIGMYAKSYLQVISKNINKR